VAGGGVVLMTRLCQSPVRGWWDWQGPRCNNKKKALSRLQHHIVEEFATLRGWEVPMPSSQETQEMYAGAVWFLHMKLLQDIAPPWVARPFPHALPGDGVMCRYTKPAFLRLHIARAECLFGDAGMATWRWVARAVDAEVAGLQARPLYACTQTRADGGTCMALAAMSPLPEQKAAHTPFACARCQREAAGAPASGSAPRRVWRLYVLVPTVAGRSTVLRTYPLHVIVDAPLDNVRWGLGFAGNAPAFGSASRRVLRLYVLVHSVVGRSTVLRTSP